MKQFYLPITFLLDVNKLIFVILLMISNSIQAQSEPFECDFNAYLFQYNDIYALDLASGGSYLVAENITEGNINAAAYNSADGYIWGYLSSPSKSIVRIGKNYEPEIYTIPEIPNTNNKYVGDITIDGIYYLRSGGTTYYAIDLNPESNSYLEFIGSYTLNKNISIHDWAFNAVDGKLYSVEKNTNHLYRITAETGEVEDLGLVPILAGFSYTYGAVYFDIDGNFYVSANQTGSVYKINNVQLAGLNVMVSNIFAFGPASASNDGARCPTAPVPQEDCRNGVDDDGDGLVDCDDPSCSGISLCPTVTTTSGGNDGGLESNDRLSNLINKRNFNRASTNYKFDKLSAKAIKKSFNYKRKGGFSSKEIPLSTLVPLGIIGESSTIESSPADLIELTNASDIFSVDYLKDTETVSALMIIKTENKVYEHSKFICDRFLGAELLSVSNIQIRENNFIKSIIKQADGNTEFALTFSVRMNEANEFIVESHWNIDAYEKDSSFYNFQIWSNSVDDLYKLGEEILNLLEVNNPIKQYKSSTPPPVFIKSASYQKGNINLELINNNNSNLITLEGGMKKTETSSTNNLSLSTEINSRLESLSVETGPLFDFGFRIQNEKGDTPDDLFVADAPWGLDNSAENTTIESYEVLQNNESYAYSGYRVERNVYLKGNTSSYLGVYRALTPRFKAVDLSKYKKMNFMASGSGTLEVKILKGNGSYYTSKVNLTEEIKEIEMLATDFKNEAGVETDFADLKVLLFNISSSDGTMQEKEITISEIDFNNRSEIVDKPIVKEKLNTKALVYPNPLVAETKLYFSTENQGSYTLDFFTLSGMLLSNHSISGEYLEGANEILIQRKNLSPGIYFYKLASSSNQIWSGKIIVK
ncbi:T9SS type A sorting domain-containing protein [Cellulophaga sp. HaHaR_3_176]|uniref:T9SS type A sorting domain-containing protein n=1 Tax=Cellulophaga sp. HaHaR_3_176 TaxID=1942464 RepID=UPI001C1F86D5|nr:T9SS type A sorting domain-containing protein [Cellulophaga sp. HaHaR_3_176]QWX85527.1 T9SS type A sorting domain-containing protein [Cellulophaga sp. HaHaR_3_176]